jgi:hypothetical protein
MPVSFIILFIFSIFVAKSTENLIIMKNHSDVRVEYCAPMVEIIFVSTETGFAATGSGSVDNWTLDDSWTAGPQQ